MNKAVFILLDDILITTRSGKSYPIHSEDWKFTIGWYDFLKRAVDNNYKICIIGEQFGVDYGLISMKAFTYKIETICNILEKELTLSKNSIATNFVYVPSIVFNTKPNPGLLYELAVDYEILLKDSILVGKTDEDRQLATNAGVEFFHIYDVDPHTKSE